MQHINPATGQKTEFSETKDITGIVAKSRDAATSWSRTSIKDRINILHRANNELLSRSDEIAHAITSDIGKPIKAALSEVERSNDKTQYYLKNAKKFLKPTKVSMGNVVVYDPLGVIAVITPWNYPVSLAIGKIIPCLLTGNTVICKPSELTPRTGLVLDDIFTKHLPPHVFQTIVGTADAGKKLVKSNIDLVSFVGSIATGKNIMKNSSDKLHKLVLELGGLDAAIVMPDADLEHVSSQIVYWNTNNSGQICCAIKRVIAHEDIYDKLVELIRLKMKKTVIGDPETEVDMGPIVSEKQLKRILEFIADARRKGAQIQGGKRLKRKGFFIEPAVITKVKPSMRLMYEEPFGPILPIVEFKDVKDAVKIANSTDYGLTSSVWTRSKKFAKLISEQLNVGIVAINSHGGGPMGTPWGGAKQSGIGRQNNREGVLAFTNTKLVRIG